MPLFGNGGLLNFGPGMQNLFAGLQDAGVALNGGQGNALNRVRQSRLEEMAAARPQSRHEEAHASAAPLANPMGGGGLLDFGERIQNLMAGFQDLGAALQGQQGSAVDNLRRYQLARERLDRAPRSVGNWPFR